MKKNKDVVEKSYKEALKELEELVVKIEDPLQILKRYLQR